MSVHVKKSTLTLAILICLITSVHGQTKRIIRSEAIQDNLSLAIELIGTKYKEGDFIETNYRVSNKSNQDIFLVTVRQPDIGYNEEHRDIGSTLYKTIHTYHYFES